MAGRLWAAFQGGEHAIARSLPDCHCIRFRAARLPELPLQTIVKVVTSGTVHRVALEAAQIFGGMGVMRGLPIQKYVRDALIFLHSENSNDVARLRIAEDLAGCRRPGSIATGG